MLPAIFSDNKVSFTITDGQFGDDDLAADGTIVNQGGPGVSPLPAVAIKALYFWAVGLLITFFGMSRLRLYRPKK
jgi:trimeric autotransporter adhesin